MINSSKMLSVKCDNYRYEHHILYDWLVEARSNSELKVICLCLWRLMSAPIIGIAVWSCTHINTWRPRQNGRHSPDNIFNCIFLNENVSILIKISLMFVPDGPINNIPALVKIMAWHRPGDKPLSEPMIVSLLTHICITRPQWVNCLSQTYSMRHRAFKIDSQRHFLIWKSTNGTSEPVWKGKIWSLSFNMFKSLVCSAPVIAVPYAVRQFKNCDQLFFPFKSWFDKLWNMFEVNEWMFSLFHIFLFYKDDCFLDIKKKLCAAKFSVAPYRVQVPLQMHPLQYNIAYSIAMTEAEHKSDVELIKPSHISSSWLSYGVCRWFSSRLQYLQCLSNGDTAV